MGTHFDLDAKKWQSPGQIAISSQCYCVIADRDFSGSDNRHQFPTTLSVSVIDFIISRHTSQT